MKRETLNLWIEALESGKYKKGTGMLRSKDDRFCCLGVFCEVIGLKAETYKVGSYEQGYSYDNHLGTLSNGIKDQYKFFSTTGARKSSPYISLTHLNDWSDTFEPIIEKLKRNPEQYFEIED